MARLTARLSLRSGSSGRYFLRTSEPGSLSKIGDCLALTFGVQTLVRLTEWKKTCALHSLFRTLGQKNWTSNRGDYLDLRPSVFSEHEIKNTHLTRREAWNVSG
jgi:hypothetical protein